MENKVYQTIYVINLYTDVKTGEKDDKGNPKVIPIDFSGCNLHRKQGGVFATTDKNLQKLIEKDPRFTFKKKYEPGKEFYLKDVIKIKDEKPKVETIDPKTIVQVKTEEEDIVKEANEKIFDEATTAQEAKDILFDLYPDLTARELGNTTQIKKIAKDNDIKFPNWPNFNK